MLRGFSYSGMYVFSAVRTVTLCGTIGNPRACYEVASWHTDIHIPPAYVVVFFFASFVSFQFPARDVVEYRDCSGTCWNIYYSLSPRFVSAVMTEFNDDIVGILLP